MLPVDENGCLALAPVKRAVLESDALDHAPLAGEVEDDGGILPQDPSPALGIEDRVVVEGHLHVPQLDGAAAHHEPDLLEATLVPPDLQNVTIRPEVHFELAEKLLAAARITPRAGAAAGRGVL